MTSKPIEQSSHRRQKEKAKRRNLLAIILVFIGLFATLTMAVINQPLWAFGLAGGFVLLLVAIYGKEILQSLKKRR